MKYRRLIWGIIVLALVTVSVGCNGKIDNNVNNEKKEDGKKIEVSMMSTDELPEFEALVESTYEDVDLVVEKKNITIIDSESEKRLRNNEGTDIILTTMPNDVVQKYTYDLSTEPFVRKYQADITKTLLINGETHYIPLPNEFKGYVINKTLLDELGMELPDSNKDLLEIFSKAQEKKIGAGAYGDVFAFQCYSESYVASYLMNMMVPDFLGCPEGIEWLYGFKNDSVTLANTWKNEFDFIIKCRDKGYLNVTDEHINYDKTAVNVQISAEKRMLEGSLLVSYLTVSSYNHLNENSDEYEYVMLPLLSDEDNEQWVGSVTTNYLAINNSIDDKKLEACIRVFELLSTVEGQQAWINDTDAVFSYLTDYEENLSVVPENIRTLVDKGYVYTPPLDDSAKRYFGNQMIDVLQGKMELAEALKNVDDYRAERQSLQLDNDH